MRRFLYHTTTVLWRDLFQVSDRAGRREYFRVAAMSCIVYPMVAHMLLLIVFEYIIGAGMLDLSEGTEYSDLPPGAKIYEALSQAVQFHVLLAFVTIAIRRLHDMGLSGYFLAVVAFVTVLILFVASELGVLKLLLPWLFLADMVIFLFIYFALGIPGSRSKPNRWGEGPSPWPPDERSDGQQEQPENA